MRVLLDGIILITITLFPLHLSHPNSYSNEGKWSLDKYKRHTVVIHFVMIVLSVRIDL